MAYLTPRALINSPFLEIIEMGSNDVPGETFEMLPNIISQAQAVAFPRNDSQFSVITEFRRDQVSGIGNP